MDSRQRKKRRKKDLNLIKKLGYFVACDGNVYKATTFIPLKEVYGSPFYTYEVEGISLDGKDIHFCSIDHCLADILSKEEAKKWKNPFKCEEV